MQKLALKAEKRDVFGKKLKKLRKEGMVPANIYGPDFKSVSIKVGFKDFVKTFKVAKETGVVYITLGKDEIPTLIKAIQIHPVNDTILHVDFRKIDLTKKVQTEVPVKVVGSSEAVAQKGGVLLIQSDMLQVEALPSNIPHEIEVDISIIKEIGGEIKVSDLKKSEKYEVKTPAEKVVVSVVAHKEESITPETTSAAPEVITEKPAEEEAAAAPGEAPAKKETTADKAPAKETPPPKK